MSLAASLCARARPRCQPGILRGKMHSRNRCESATKTSRLATSPTAPGGPSSLEGQRRTVGHRACTSSRTRGRYGRRHCARRQPERQSRWLLLLSLRRPLPPRLLRAAPLCGPVLRLPHRSCALNGPRSSLSSSQLLSLFLRSKKLAMRATLTYRCLVVLCSCQMPFLLASIPKTRQQRFQCAGGSHTAGMLRSGHRGLKEAGSRKQMCCAGRSQWLTCRCGGGLKQPQQAAARALGPDFRIIDSCLTPAWAFNFNPHATSFLWAVINIIGSSVHMQGMVRGNLRFEVTEFRRSS